MNVFGGIAARLPYDNPVTVFVPLEYRAWTDAQLDAAEERLRSAGWFADGTLTEAGRKLREDLELSTDAQMAPAVHALGQDLPQLAALLEPWARQVMAANGYPPSPLAITRS